MTNYWICPLYSFNYREDLDWPPQTINFVEGIDLQRITAQIKNHLQTHYPDSEASVADYAIVIPYNLKISKNAVSFFEEISHITQLLFDVITSFRLCHEGGIIPGPLIPLTSSNQSLFGDIFTNISKIEIDYTSLGISEYEFYHSDIPIFNKLLTSIRTHHRDTKFNALNEAFRRFNSSYSGEPEDRLIDQMIAFESLYIGDDKELGYKLGLRTAFFLGKQREKTYKNMKTAYDLRGQIVHGNKRVQGSKLEEIIPKTEEYLRQSIRRFLLLLSQGMSLQQIRDKLDENILKNSKTLAIRE